MKNTYHFNIVKKNEKIGLLPCSEDTKQFLEKKLLKNETELQLQESGERILKHHRKLFAIMKTFLDNFDIEMKIEELLIYLKIKAGYYKEITMKGQKITIPKSISFSEMDQEEFKVFYDLSVGIMANVLGITKQQLENNTELI